MENNFTTIEQSTRLLEIGVPQDSADCYFDFKDGYSKVHVWQTDGYKNWVLKKPCWSVGQLIRIFVKIRGYEDGLMSIDGNEPIEYLLILYCMGRKSKLDFSKLDK